MQTSASIIVICALSFPILLIDLGSLSIQYRNQRRQARFGLSAQFQFGALLFVLIAAIAIALVFTVHTSLQKNEPDVVRIPKLVTIYGSSTILGLSLHVRSSLVLDVLAHANSE
jgi:hypothetical protein